MCLKLLIERFYRLKTDKLNKEFKSIFKWSDDVDPDKPSWAGPSGAGLDYSPTGFPLPRGYHHRWINYRYPHFILPNHPLGICCARKDCHHIIWNFIKNEKTKFLYPVI